jgi:omega-amidase
MRVALCQLDIVWEDKPANCRKVEVLLSACPPAEDSLLILPEMFATGFSLDVSRIAEGTERETERFLARIARTYHVFVLGGVVTAGPDGRGRNQAVVFDPAGEPLARYTKMHPFTYGGESAHFTRGDGPVLFPCGDFIVAPFICYDLRFPEPFRAAVRQGAQLFVVIASWPAPRADHWATLLRARAIENQAYVVGVNRCGRDPLNEYDGHSMVVDPRGAVRVDMGSAEGLRSAELDLPSLLAYRRDFPALADLHPEYTSGRPNSRCSAAPTSSDVSR